MVDIIFAGQLSAIYSAHFAPRSRSLRTIAGYPTNLIVICQLAQRSVLLRNVSIIPQLDRHVPTCSAQRLAAQHRKLSHQLDRHRNRA